jgi:hypothetical protein
MIISHADRRTLAACLRVSKSFFHLAGRKLYARIEIDDNTGWTEIMAVSEIANTSLGRNNHEGARSKQATRPLKIDYKNLLLENVHTIVIRDHLCPQISRASAKETAKMMTGLNRAILAEAHCHAAFAFGNDDNCCMFADVFEYESLEIHDCDLNTVHYGYWGAFTTLLSKVRHATLVMPPISCYMSHWKPLPGDSCRAPLANLSSLNLIFADHGFDAFGIAAPRHLVSVQSLIKSVASCLKLNNWKIEIYIFNDFDNTFDLVDFREKLKIEVDDAIKAMPEKERPDWSPNYQVYGLEDYFNHPDMYLELDHEWMMRWKMERDRRQRAKRQAEERIAGIEKVCDLAEAPCGDD